MTDYLKCLNYLITQKINTQIYYPGIISYNAIYGGGEDNYFDHSIQVYNILRKWKCEPDICRAGLLHAVPLTENLKTIVTEKTLGYIKQFKENNIQNKPCRLIHLAKILSKPFISITDNFIDKQDMEDFYFYFRDKVKWEFTGSGRSLQDWRLWHYLLYHHLKKGCHFKKGLETKLKGYADKIMSNYGFSEFYNLDRCHASAYPYGTVHEIHNDYDHLHTSLTLMFYLNSTWDIQWGGETVILDSNKTEIIKSITPKPGRVLIFDGGLQHCARPLVRNFNDLRLVVAFKYSIKVEGEKQ